VSVDKLAEGVDPGQNRHHDFVHLQGILQVGPQDPSGLIVISLDPVLEFAKAAEAEAGSS
jgi:hypothetical protein